MGDLKMMIELLAWLETERYIADRLPTDGVVKARNAQAWELQQLSSKRKV